VLLELLLGCLALQSLVAVRLCQGDFHLLAVQLESAHLLDRLQRRFLAVKHNEGLSLPLHAPLRNDVENRSIMVEDGVESFIQGLRLDTLSEIVYLRLLANAALRSAM